jgi:hypothetical protein
MKPHLTYSVGDFIASSDQAPIYLKDFLEWSQIGDVQYPTYNALHEYRDILSKYAVRLALTEEEYQRFIYKPELLAFELYGYTDLYFVLLFMNNIYNNKDFKFRELNVLLRDHIPLLAKLKLR